MMKAIFGLIFTCLILQACQSRLKNSVDRDIFECGISRDDLGNRRIVRSNTQLNKSELQVFDQDGESVSEFEVTPKDCIILPESSPAASIVLVNGVAAWLNKGEVNFRPCGEDCVVFPTCGFFENGPKNNGPWVYAQVHHQATELIAIIEGDTGPEIIDVSEKSCLRVSPSAAGLIRLSDSDGNFLDTTISDLLEKSPRRKSILSISLRGPLNSDELFCKKNSGSYRLTDGTCIPKDLRDYCQDFRAQYGKKELERAFGTSDCYRIWADFSSRDRISFGAMRLSSPRFFSNLPNLRGLNVSGNPELGSFQEMKGTDKIEELIVSHSNFDIAEIALFPSLKSLVIGKVKSNWSNAPSFPQIKFLEIAEVGKFDPKILEKFPNVEELTITSDSTPASSLNILSSLVYLKKLTMQARKDVNSNISIPPNLEILDLNGSLDVFVGEFRQLRKIKLSVDDSIKNLSSASSLEEIEISVDRFQYREAYADLPKMFFPSVRKVKLENIDSFDVLKAFPSVEDLNMSISRIYSFDVPLKKRTAS